MGEKSRMFTLRSGGWVLLLAAALTLLAAAAWIVPALRARHSRAVGDGRDVSSYRFDLSTCLVSRSAIAASGLPKDGLPALQSPRAVSAPEADAARARRGRYLVGSDRVIGVRLGGEARAYPLRVLAWHEVVNDSLGGVPIAVTYNPLSEGVAVLDRRVAGEILVLAVSGLLYQSNLLMYDRRSGGAGESLWSQLEARAVAGPAAALGRTLEVLPCSLTRWDGWRAAYPSTTVLVPEDPGAEKYQRDPYGTYFSSDRLVAPVDPLPPPGGPPLKSRVLAVRSAAGWRLFPLDPDLSPVQGVRRVEIDGATIVLDSSSRPVSVLVEPAEHAPPLLYAFWFAWFATHPDMGSDITGVTTR